MEPMKPMKPMAPMKPMEPMAKTEAWWPNDWGEPSSSGSQTDLRYAFFPTAHRLLVESRGKLATYDSGDHEISGVSQQSSDGSPTFSSKDGPVSLDRLKRID